MQEFSTALNSIESFNQYPECCRLELEAIPVDSDNPEAGEFDLYLSIDFNQQWESVLGGRIEFGLKGGELRLKLHDCLMSEVTLQQNESFTLRLNSENPTDILNITCSENWQGNLSWILEIASGNHILHGLLNKIKLGTLKITDKPCYLEASFAVAKQDVRLTDAEGLWRHDLSPNKQAILSRKLSLFLRETRLQPYLSSIVLGNIDRAELNLLKDRETKPNATTEAKLQELIEIISEATTDNFLELAKIAGINLLEDFAGSNLLGTNLSGIELSGANLHGVNLRGADLTDADLSEANLSGAKLSGADLSGAYLENADLSQSDCHRASFALANLISADLSEANLISANLSNANLSAAKVDKTIFGNNPGIAEEIKLNLHERGAIFQES
jgi:uncharacterized protein YjbI with pentapeptide repeats